MHFYDANLFALMNFIFCFFSDDVILKALFYGLFKSPEKQNCVGVDVINYRYVLVKVQECEKISPRMRIAIKMVDSNF